MSGEWGYITIKNHKAESQIMVSRFVCFIHCVCMCTDVIPTCVSTCFELAGEAEDLGVVWDQVLVQLTEDKQLRPPVLSVERSLLQLQQAVPGSLQAET